MEMIRKIAMMVAAVVLVGAVQVSELQARHESRGSTSRARGDSRDASRSKRSRDDRRDSSRRHDDRYHDRYSDRSGIVPAAVGIGVGAAVLGGDIVVGTEEAVLGSRDCPRGTYYDEDLDECVEQE